MSACVASNQFLISAFAIFLQWLKSFIGSQFVKCSLELSKSRILGRKYISSTCLPENVINTDDILSSKQMKIPRLTWVKMAVYTHTALTSLALWLKSSTFSSSDILVPFAHVHVRMSRFVHGAFKTHQPISMVLSFRADWIIAWVTLHPTGY